MSGVREEGSLGAKEIDSACLSHNFQAGSHAWAWHLHAVRLSCLHPLALTRRLRPENRRRRAGRSQKGRSRMSRVWTFQDDKQVKKHGEAAASWYVGWFDPAGKNRCKSCGPGRRLQHNFAIVALLEQLDIEVKRRRCCRLEGYLSVDLLVSFSYSKRSTGSLLVITHAPDAHVPPAEGLRLLHLWSDGWKRSSKSSPSSAVSSV